VALESIVVEDYGAANERVGALASREQAVGSEDEVLVRRTLLRTEAASQTSSRCTLSEAAIRLVHTLLV